MVQSHDIDARELGSPENGGEQTSLSLAELPDNDPDSLGMNTIDEEATTTAFMGIGILDGDEEKPYIVPGPFDLFEMKDYQGARLPFNMVKALCALEKYARENHEGDFGLIAFGSGRFIKNVGNIAVARHAISGRLGDLSDQEMRDFAHQHPDFGGEHADLTNSDLVRNIIHDQLAAILAHEEIREHFFQAAGEELELPEFQFERFTAMLRDNEAEFGSLPADQRTDAAHHFFTQLQNFDRALVSTEANWPFFGLDTSLEKAVAYAIPITHDEKKSLLQDARGETINGKNGNHKARDPSMIAYRDKLYPGAEIALASTVIEHMGGTYLAARGGHYFNIGDQQRYIPQSLREIGIPFIERHQIDGQRRMSLDLVRNRWKALKGLDGAAFRVGEGTRACDPYYLRTKEAEGGPVRKVQAVPFVEHTLMPLLYDFTAHEPLVKPREDAILFDAFLKRYFAVHLAKGAPVYSLMRTATKVDPNAIGNWVNDKSNKVPRPFDLTKAIQVVESVCRSIAVKLTERLPSNLMQQSV